MTSEVDQIFLIHENKGWFGKFLDVWKNAQFGHIYVNKKSKNVNIYFGFRKLAGKVLIWSTSRKARWVTKKWFKNGHSMVLWPDKTRMRVCLEVFGRSFEGMGPKDWDILTEYLSDSVVQSELESVTREIQANLEQYIIGLPFVFILPWLVLFISILIYITYLDILEIMTW